MYKEIIQEEINSPYSVGESDILFSANIVEGQPTPIGSIAEFVPSIDIGVWTVNVVKIETIGAEALLIGNDETPVSSYTFTDRNTHHIRILPGKRLIKITRVDRISHMLFQNLISDMNLISGNFRFTNVETFGVGNILFMGKQLPIESLFTKYVSTLYLQSIPGNIESLDNLNGYTRIYQNHCKECFGDISCFANNDKLQLCYLRNNSVTGDIENFAESIDWIGGTSPTAIMIDGSLIYGNLDNLFDKWVAKHMDTKRITIICNGIVTLNGTPVDGRVKIDVTKDTGWTLVERT